MHGLRFDPWSGKWILHAPTKSSHAATKDPVGHIYDWHSQKRTNNSAKKSPQPRPPSSWSWPLGPEWHSLPGYRVSWMHILIPSALTLLCWELRSFHSWAKTPFKHTGPANPSCPRPHFYCGWTPLTLLPWPVSSSKGVLPLHVSPRSTTHFLQLLPQPGMGSA